MKSGLADQKPDQSPNEIKSFISHSQHQPKTRRDLRGTARVGPFNVSTQLCGCNAQSKLPIALQTTPILSHILRASNHSHSLAHSSALPLFQSQHNRSKFTQPRRAHFCSFLWSSLISSHHSSYLRSPPPHRQPRTAPCSHLVKAQMAERGGSTTAHVHLQSTSCPLAH